MMRGSAAPRARRFVAWLALVAGCALAMVEVPQPCDACLQADYWSVSADDWNVRGTPVFPETEQLDAIRMTDLGVAFSGGGSRSAAAALGQLRGLRANGWLDRVRYVSAVSGGAWTVVPFTYTLLPLDDLLGAYKPPSTLSFDSVKNTPNGDMARAIVDSSLWSSGLREAGLITSDRLFARKLDTIKRRIDEDLKARRDSVRADKTYSHLIRDVFIEPFVPGAGGRRFALDDRMARGIVRDNPNTLSYADFITGSLHRRPFLIVGATVVLVDPSFTYPRLIPIEYTPIYSGARQHFGDRLGGTYLASWAYDAGRAISATESPAGGSGKVRVRAPEAGGEFTLADVAASTGAAPQLFFILQQGSNGEVRRRLGSIAEFFPAFSTFAIRGGRPAEMVPSIPHGDGGFTDYVGLMPLLARQVRNIIVFVNAKDEFSENRDIESFFRSVRQQDGSGDKSMNAVFREERLLELRSAFRKKAIAGKALIHCGQGWEVLKNYLYNIRGYADLNICWVYNRAVPTWTQQIGDDKLKALLTERDAENEESSDLENFPWFKTFGQNGTRLIKLTTLQVNLLSDLAGWTVAGPENAEVLRRGLKRVLDESHRP